MEIKLHIINLPSEFTESDLLDLITQAGSVIRVRIIQNQATSESKRSAIVTMKSQEDANKVIDQFNGYSLGYGELVVSLALPHKRSTLSNYFSNQGNGNLSNYPRNRSGGS